MAMILLDSALHKGLIGALGAGFCYLLFVLGGYYKDTFKRYRAYLRKKDSSLICARDVLAFSLLSGIITWIAIFGIFCTIFNWRTLSAETNAAIGAVAALAVMALIIYSYWNNFNLPSFAIQMPAFLKPEKKPTFAFESKSPTTRFNFWYSFDYLPKKLDAYSRGQIAFKNVVSTVGLPASYHKDARKIVVTYADVPGHPEIEVSLILVPSTQTMGEVVCLMIVRDVDTRQACLYSLEYSIGECCVCLIEESRHYNMGGSVSSTDELLQFCIDHFLSIHKPKEAAQPTESKPTPSPARTNHAQMPSSTSTTMLATPLLEFASKFGKMQVGSFTTQESGQSFKACIFTDADGNKKYVSFSSVIGELTPAQISEQKNELFVEKLPNGTYQLTRALPTEAKLLFDPIFIRHSLDIMTQSVYIFKKANQSQITHEEYTEREVWLLVSSLILGKELIRQLSRYPDNSFLKTLFDKFVGEYGLRNIIDRMSGMSMSQFGDKLHITRTLSDALEGCTSVSFEDKTYNGKKIRMLNLFQSMNCYTLVHLSDELKDITLQDVFNRKEDLYLNELCKNDAPCPVCTPINQWPTLETFNRAETGYKNVVLKFLIDRIEYYNFLYSTLPCKASYCRLVAGMLHCPLEKDCEFAFNYSEECDPQPLDDTALDTFKQSIQEIYNCVKTDGLYF